MLSYFKIQNFKSILDLTLDLSFAEGKAPNGYEEWETIPFIGKSAVSRFVPTLALYGPNASGKTNILNALNVFKALLGNGFIGKYMPNKLNDKYRATSFELSFYLNGNNYIYLIEYNTIGIIGECLYKLNKKKKEIVFEISEDKLFFDNIATKEYTPPRLKEIYKVECKNEQSQQWLPFLACIAKKYAGLNRTIPQVFNYFIDNIEVYISNNPPMPLGIEKLAKNTTNEAFAEAFGRITDVLKKLDIDISKMTMERKFQKIEDITKPVTLNIGPETFVGQRNDMIVMDTIHSHHINTKGEEVIFKFNEESEGTRTLSGLLGLFLCALENGKVIFVDELERSLHPLLLIEVIRFFKEKRYNPNGAQLIFTAHNTDILDDTLMRVSEISVLNKTLKEGTTIKRISDFEGVRNISNFRRQYLNGLFSGIPYPYI